MADALLVAHDLGYLTEADIGLMRASEDADIRAAVNAIDTPSPLHEGGLVPVISYYEVGSALRREFAAIEADPREGVTPKRAAWLAREAKRRALSFWGAAIGDAIREGRLSADAEADFLADFVANHCRQAFAEGIRCAIESAARIEGFTAAAALYARYREVLLKFWRINDAELRKTLRVIFRRLYRLGIAELGALAQCQIGVYDLARPVSENMVATPELLEEARQMAAMIAADAELSAVLPVCLVFGSRLKGYGEEDADADLAVFVRAGTPYARMYEITDMLNTKLVHGMFRGAPLVFWLDHGEEGLRVHDFSDPQAGYAQSYCTHVLFGAVWAGEEAIVRHLREQLLLSYLRRTDIRVEDQNARMVWLCEMERDALLYRLLHYGYARFFPSRGGIETPFSFCIEGQSAFYDPGYRELASRLYLRRVFLPIAGQ